MNAHPFNRIAGDPETEQRVLSHVKGALRVMVDWRAPAVSLDRKQTGIRHALRSYLRHLQRLLDLEEQGGYLEDLVESRPNLQERVEKLRAEHEQIRESIRNFSATIDNSDAWVGDHFDGSCDSIRVLLEEVDNHDRQEIALLQDSMLTDVGGEGG